VEQSVLHQFPKESNYDFDRGEREIMLGNILFDEQKMS
jgi:hypothetical protein